MRMDVVPPTPAPPRALLCTSSNQVQLPNFVGTTLEAGPVGRRDTGIITGARAVPVGATRLVGAGTGCRGGGTTTGAIAVVVGAGPAIVLVVVVGGDATGVRGGETKLVGVAGGAGNGLQPVFQVLPAVVVAVVVVLGADGGIAGAGGATGAVGVVWGAAGIAHRGAHGLTTPAVTVALAVLPAGVGPVGAVGAVGPGTTKPPLPFHRCIIRLSVAAPDVVCCCGCEADDDVVPDRQSPGCAVHDGIWDGVCTNGKPAACHWDTPRAL
jgi:hypothetical protein